MFFVSDFIFVLVFDFVFVLVFDFVYDLVIVFVYVYVSVYVDRFRVRPHFSPTALALGFQSLIGAVCSTSLPVWRKSVKDYSYSSVLDFDRGVLFGSRFLLHNDILDPPGPDFRYTTIF